MLTVRMAMMAAAMVMGLTAPASAEYFYDGNKLMEFCTEDNQGGQGICLGYITGVYDATEGCKQLFSYSTPENVVAGQIKKVVLLWLEKKPELLHLPARLLIPMALKEAWPCP